MLTLGGARARGLLRLSLAGLAGLAGCTVSTDLPRGARISCSSDAQCPSQTHCVAALQRCVADGNGDGTPAELASATLTPAVAIPGDLVELDFATNERLGIPPSAWLTRGEARLPMSLAEFSEAAGVFRYAVTGEEAEGEWQVQVAAVDEVGNAATLSAGAVALDVSGPSIVDVAWQDVGGGVGTSSAPRVTARVSAPARIVGAVAVVDGQPRLGLAASLLPTLDPAWLSLVAVLPVPDLALSGAGTLRVELTVADAAGNETTSATSELPYDVVAPETSLDAAPPATSHDVDVTLAFSGGAGTASFSCSLDGALPSPCTSPLALTDLSLGAHTFSVAAVDAEGNRDPTPAAATWTTARRWAAFSAGLRHTCAVGSDDRLFCFGDNTSAQLGRGSALTAAAAGDPGQVASGQARFRSVSGGWTHTCAVGRDGSLWCWGGNDFGQLGIGAVSAVKDSPVRVGAATDWLAVSAGYQHTCGLRGSPSGAELHCWGRNTSGALGLGSAVPAGAIRPAPVRVGEESDWLGVAIAHDTSVAVREDGGSRTVWWWGSQAGAAAPQLVVGPTDVVQVSKGLAHACARTSAGALWCWGNNDTGATQGSSGAVHGPEAVLAGRRWRDVSAGQQLTCGVEDTGALVCWGRNDRGQLGTGASSATLGPTVVDDQHDWVGVSARPHVCAWSSAGEAVCFGDDTAGQLGQGFVADASYAPRRVAGDAVFGSFDLARFSPLSGRVCGVVAGGALSCWGEDDVSTGAADLLLNGAMKDLDVPGPATAAAGPTWTSVSQGAVHACFLASDHRAYCGGPNYSGETGAPDQYGGVTLGEIPFDASFTPSTDWLAVSAGDAHSCGIRGASLPGSLWCWGTNSFYGALGQGNTDHLEWPRQVAGAWRAAAAGASHTCAIRGDGTLWCWGAGGGAWVNCSGAGYPSPQQLGADADWLAVAAGVNTTCGIRDAGGSRRLACWGSRFWGTPDACAIHLFPETGWLEVSLGSGHVCGIRATGGGRTLWCWGDNGDGQLGFTTDLDRIDVQTQVGSDTDWASVRAGDANTCATKLDGSMWCWGSYERGVVGDGLSWAEVPVTVPVP